MEIKSCIYKSDFQDKEYGKGLRAKNSAKEGRWRCTVCGKGAKSLGHGKVAINHGHKAEELSVEVQKRLGIAPNFKMPS